MNNEQPFQICIPDTKIERLRQKLELVDFPDELDDAGWDYGAPLSDIQRLVERWRTGYDWKKHETLLNSELPQFTRDIEVEGFGILNIHYVHKKSAVGSAIPLLFVHGWPGCFLEVRKILPLLVKGSPSFHVVAISLPGFGFSTAPKQKGFKLQHYAEVCNKLMLSLGYEEYVTQGGDWGSRITRKIAEVDRGKHSKAWHTNWPFGPPPHPIGQPWQFIKNSISWHTADEQAGMERTSKFQREGRGYFSIQSTKPQTLGYGLTDSPVGLLAWIYEKLVDWTDSYPWTDDEGRVGVHGMRTLKKVALVLTWVSIYWFSRSGPTASTRIYYEVTKGDGLTLEAILPPPPIPHGVSYFPKELVTLPKSWVARAANIVFESQHDKGGHFAAHEVPELLVADLRKMFGKGGPAYGVIPTKVGYE
ncbi:alpha/beta-hydrolase [Pluteus cervinus]|uniref:Alpha/beta-hydrolase n=1 Tax=Pluteus cervinus TaxID=181527 RepID=A0ACD3ABY6_9AGAR|nr:alpha/beta-hydrolase [Pluteus cervinus]